MLNSASLNLFAAIEESLRNIVVDDICRYFAYFKLSYPAKLTTCLSRFTACQYHITASLFFSTLTHDVSLRIKLAQVTALGNEAIIGILTVNK